MPDEDDIVPEEIEETPKAKKTPDPVPYARFREVVQQRRDLETKLNTAETALTAAETEKLAAVKKFTELESSAQATMDELRGKLAAQDEIVTKYKQIISSTVDDTTQDWPEEVKVFDPGADADPAVRLEWAKKAQLLVAKLGAQSGAAGMNPKPTPKQPAVDKKDIVPDVDVRRSF